MHHSTTLALNLALGLAAALATSSVAHAAPPAESGPARGHVSSDVVKLSGHSRVSGARQRGLLMRFDVDGDGVFDKKELSVIRAELSREVVRRFDADGDHALDAAERDEARRSAESSRHGKGYGLLLRFDVDGDGTFDHAELKRVREAVHAAAIARFDVDHDGQLSDAERAALRRANAVRIKSLQERHADGKGPQAEGRGRRDPVENRVDAPGVGSNAEIGARGRRPAPERRPAPGPGAGASG